MSGPVVTGGTPAGAKQGIVWRNFNRISSDNQFEERPLDGVTGDALRNDIVVVDGQKKVQATPEGDFRWEPFPTEGSFATRDQFDQVQAFAAQTHGARFVQSLGFDLIAIGGDHLPFPVHVNAVPDINAWMNPRKHDVTLGRGERAKRGPWSLGADWDINIHEGIPGHLLLQLINPYLTSWGAREGGAIHEGFGDAGAFFVSGGDPEISEGFPWAMGRDFGPGLGLRTVDNDLSLDKVTKEVHNRGRVYGGFFARVARRLAPFVGNDMNAALRLGAAFMINHGAHLATNKPTSQDFADGYLAGAKAYLAANTQYGLTYDLASRVIHAEARKRAMLDANLRTGSREAYSAAYARWLDSPNNKIVLKPAATTVGTFGGRHFKQHFLTVNVKHEARVMGSGLIVFLNQQGEPVSYSKADLREIDDINLDGTFRVKRGEALKRARDAAKALFDRSADLDEKIDRASERERFWLEMQRTADKAAYEEAQLVTDREVAELVILPKGYDKSAGDKEQLYWKFTFHFTEFYVSANDGKVIVEQRPMW